MPHTRTKVGGWRPRGFGLFLIAPLQLVLLGIGVRCYYLQVERSRELAYAQVKFTRVQEDVRGKRGRILAASGEVLVKDQLGWQIFIDPIVAAGRKAKNFEEREQRLLSRIETLHRKLPFLAQGDSDGSKRETLTRILIGALQAGSHCVALGFLSNPVERQQFERAIATAPERRAYSIEARRSRWSVEGLGLDSVLGVLGSDYWYYGIERQAEDELRAFDGVAWRRRDARNRRALDEFSGNRPAVDGTDVTLTIDLECQRVLLEALVDVVDRTSARLVTGIIADPQTGEILAIASLPTADQVRTSAGLVAANYDQLPKTLQLLMAPHFLALSYQPGSTIKPFVVAEALDRGVPIDTILKPREAESMVLSKGRARRRLTDVHVDGPLSLEGALIHSSNIGLATLGLHHLGQAGLRSMIRRFGFTQSTEIELANEQVGYGPHTRNNWNHHSTISVSIGYEIMITPLQLVRAYCALANGGFRVDLHLRKDSYPDLVRVDQLADEDREERRLLSGRTTEQVQRWLRAAIAHAEETDPRLVQWGSQKIQLAGKTGTAAMVELNPETGKVGFSKENYRSSFIGFAPVDNPKYLMMIVAEKPKGAYYGSQVARPSVIRALSQLLAEETRIQESLSAEPSRAESFDRAGRGEVDARGEGRSR